MGKKYPFIFFLNPTNFMLIHTEHPIKYFWHVNAIFHTIPHNSGIPIANDLLHQIQQKQPNEQIVLGQNWATKASFSDILLTGFT